MRMKNAGAVNVHTKIIETKLKNNLSRLMRFGTMKPVDDEQPRNSDFEISDNTSQASPDKQAKNQMNAKMMWKALGTKVLSDIDKAKKTVPHDNFNSTPLDGVSQADQTAANDHEGAHSESTPSSFLPPIFKKNKTLARLSPTEELIKDENDHSGELQAIQNVDLQQ